MRKLSIFIVLFFSLNVSFSSVFGQVVWLRGDRNSALSTVWPDVSGNKKDATATKEESPTKNGSLNFNKTVTFDGVNDYMKVPYSLEGLSMFTIITVFRSADTTERGVWGAENALSRNTRLTTRQITGPDSVVDHYGKNENIPVINTIAQNWIGSTAAGNDAFLALASSGKQGSNQLFKGAIAEFIVFDKILAGIERVQFETYLAVKYGIPLQGNYISSNEVMLWNAKDNRSFSNRITGIGRDDAFSLNQKQSKSVHDASDLLTIGIKSLEVSNDENKAQIDDGNFLIWGDNGKGLTCKPEVQNASLSIIDRQWLINVTGNTAQKLSTILRVDVSKLPADSLGYWLVIDRSGKGDFSEEKLEYVFPDSISADGIAYFKNIQWDTDQSGSDMFSFAKARPLFAMVNSLVQPTCIDQTSGSMTLKIIGGKEPYQYELKNRTQNSLRKGEGAQYLLLTGLSAGDYTYKIKDSKNNTIERTFSLKLPDELIVDLGEDRDIRLSPNKEIILDATANISNAAPVTYKWTSSHGFTSQEGKIKITQSGIYKVTATNAQGCDFTDEIIVSGAVSKKFDVFPAPVSVGDNYKVGVSLDEPDAVTIKVCDLRGNILKELKGNLNAEHHFINSLQVPGMYLIVLQTSKGVEAKKIIVH